MNSRVWAKLEEIHGNMATLPLHWESRVQWAVSLTFRKLPKIFSRKYTTPEITFMVRISIWKCVRVPKARLWAHVQSFSLKFSSQVLFVEYTNFERIFWRARETLVKQPPGSSASRREAKGETGTWAVGWLLNMYKWSSFDEIRRNPSKSGNISTTPESWVLSVQVGEKGSKRRGVGGFGSG